jgi:hypothetical protein
MEKFKIITTETVVQTVKEPKAALASVDVKSLKQLKLQKRLEQIQLRILQLFISYKRDNLLSLRRTMLLLLKLRNGTLLNATVQLGATLIVAETNTE